MDEWENTPRLAFLSPEPGSGKSRALELTRILVPHPVMSMNSTPAYLFRKVSDKAGLPTVLYDEIDTVFGVNAKGNEDLRGFINAGHRRGATAGRCVTKGNNIETEDYPAYCAVAMAGLGALPPTILSRSIPIRMRKRKKNEHVEPYRQRDHEPEGHALRERLTAWAEGIKGKVGVARPRMPDGVEDRDADVWEPLLAIADEVGGKWPQVARVSAVTLVTFSKRDGGASLGVRLLSDLRTIFDNDDKLHTQTILSKLYTLEESPWSNIKDKPLSDRSLAFMLKDYGIDSKSVRERGKDAKKGYERADFLDAWDRYCPLPVLQEESQESHSLPPIPWASVTEVTANENSYHLPIPDGWEWGGDWYSLTLEEQALETKKLKAAA